MCTQNNRHITKRVHTNRPQNNHHITEMEDGKIDTSSLAIVPVCVAQYVSLTSDVLEKVMNIALSAEIMHSRATFNSQWFDQIVVEGSEVSFQEAFRVYKEEFFFLLNKILADEDDSFTSLW
jgi:hypothetical protein